MPKSISSDLGKVEINTNQYGKKSKCVLIPLRRSQNQHRSTERQLGSKVGYEDHVDKHTWFIVRI